MTAARVVSVRFMTILSKTFWEESVQKLCFLLLKFAVPVIKFVVVELAPLEGGNEFLEMNTPIKQDSSTF